MNYIYGQLQKQVEKVEYTAIDTESATTTIDQTNRTIQVDVNIDGEGPIASKEYVKDAVAVEQKAREDVDEKLQRNIEAVDTKLTEEIVARKQTDETLQNNIDKKQDTLVSGENIKTINGKSVLGKGDLDVHDVVVSDVQPTNDAVVWISPKESPWKESLLSRLSWSEIAAISESGKASQYFNIGDEKQITLGTGETITMLILGFNHDDLSDGSGKAGITFGMKNCLGIRYQMDSSGYANAGWPNCSMRDDTIPLLYEQLPADVRSVIKTVTKLTGSYVLSGTLQPTNDRLFLLSVVEVMGTNYSSPGNRTSFAGEGTQYDYYKNAIIPKPVSGTGEFSIATDTTSTFYTSDKNVATDYVDRFGNIINTFIKAYYNYNNSKGYNDASKSATLYWLRSPYNNKQFCLITQGEAATSDADGTFGVAYAFCV